MFITANTKGLLLKMILNQFHLPETLTAYFLKFHLNIILPSPFQLSIFQMYYLPEIIFPSYRSLVDFTILTCKLGTRGSVVGWGTMLQTGWSQVRFPMRSLDFLDLPNPSGRIMTLGSTQLLAEMSTRNLPGEYKGAGA
jgi:hypothetical protein